MLEIIDSIEYFNDVEEQFEEIPIHWRLEHSLLSISKWESMFLVPFLQRNLNVEEFREYISCMSLDGPIHVDYLTVEIIEKITEYINRVPSATVVVQNDNKPPRGQVITSELIYSHMVAYRIPFEAERWNIHRLLKLIGVVSAQNEEPKKMTRKEVIQQNRELNEQRRKQFNTKG